MHATEVTQIFVDTMIKKLQKCLQAIVKPDEARSKTNAYMNPNKHGSIDNWVVLIRVCQEVGITPVTTKDKAWVILENLDGEARTYIMNKPESELSSPETVFNFPPDDSLVELEKPRIAWHLQDESREKKA